MKLTILRTPGIPVLKEIEASDKLAKQLREGETCDVPDKQAEVLIKRKIAEPAK